MNKYSHQKIEKKWQKVWRAQKVFQASDFANKPKKYVLVEFPYPSGEGLHMGHLRPYVAADVYTRFNRMRGNEVMFPMGWDAFGLPAENYAIKMGVQPSVTTKKNVANAKKQMQSWGLSFDWSREINTADPNYYKWTQWLFLQFFKKGLAYEATGLINWCPKDKTGLANEEVIDGKCERCGTVVEKKELRQWYLKITAYAEKLLEGLKHLPEWPEAVKLQQENWIGKKEGINIDYFIDGTDIKVTCFTTRPDTNFGSTFVVLGPEHPLLKDNGILKLPENIWREVENYKQKSSQTAEADRIAENRKKTGVFLGLYVLNRLTGKRLPLYVSDFVLGNVGTGAVVGVPGHDKRDFEFAQVFDLPVIRVVQKNVNDNAPIISIDQVQEDEGVMVNSDFLNGMDIHQATQKIMDYMEEKGYGKRVVNYKLRDWVFSRQRYWGEPIPLIYCEQCKNTKQKVLLIHGFEGSGEGNWLPWMKQRLEKQGFVVYNPTMPASKHPDLKKWMQELAPYIEKMGPQDVIVGHSLGSKAALHLIEQSKKQIGHVYLIASAIGEMQTRDWNYYRDKWQGADVDALRKFWETPVNLEVVNQYAKNINLLLSEDDPWVKKKTHENLPKSWNYQLWQGFGHFQAEQIPELLEFISQSKNSGWVPVSEKDLPVKLPPVKNYQPTGTGESPLAAISKWVNVKCPVCKSSAKREVNTMPNWAGSSWYWLRYTDPKDKKSFADLKKQKYWTPVDVYFGGMEHTTLHLLYSRFWNLFLYDQGLASSREPYIKRKPHGIILGPDGEKMSKSRGNVVNPQDIVDKYGADTLRMFELFLGPHEDTIAWNDKSVVGVKRFLDRVWNWVNAKLKDLKIERLKDSEKAERALHKLIKKVTEDIEQFHFNTAISAFMEFHNEVKDEPLSAESIGTFLKLLYPFAPHLVEELNSIIGGKKSLQLESWPAFDPAKIVDATVEIVVQVNSKVKGHVTVPPGSDENHVKQQALTIVGNQNIKRVIFVADRLINFVV